MVRGILFHRVTPVPANGCHQGGVAHVWVITLERQERRAPGVLVSAFSDQVQPPQGSPRHERCTPRPGMCGQSTAGYRSSGDRKSTRLNSTHVVISSPVFCSKQTT